MFVTLICGASVISPSLIMLRLSIDTRQRAAAVFSRAESAGFIAIEICRLATGARNRSGIGHRSRTARSISRVSSTLPRSPGGVKLERVLSDMRSAPLQFAIALEQPHAEPFVG